MQALGQQDGGFLQSFAGLRVVQDANVGTLYGAGTNEDEIYIIYSPDMRLYEGDQVVELFRTVGSSETLTARLRLYAYSFFVPGRQPKAISHLSGTGLATPTW